MGKSGGIYPKLALYRSKNKCARTDTVFFSKSQVLTRGVTLIPTLLSFFVEFWKWQSFFLISLAIPRPSPSGIHWPITFNKKIYVSVYFQKRKSDKLKLGYPFWWFMTICVMCYIERLRRKIGILGRHLHMVWNIFS